MTLQTVLNGIPTRPIVDRLLARVRSMKAGEVLSYQEIETASGESRESNRFNTIRSTLRRRALNELGIALLSERGEGYRYPTGSEQLRAGVTTMKHAARKCGRGVKQIGQVVDDRLDAPGRERRDHILTRARYLQELARSETKTLLLTVGKTNGVGK